MSDMCKFKDGDRFYVMKGTVKEYGTVLHRRTMYGDINIVYMVRYDNPEMNEHNGYEKEMFKDD